MTTHNRNLLVIFMGLLLVNVLFFFLGSQRTGVSFDENKFILADTAGISNIQIGEGVALSKNTGKWRVNDQYPADPSVSAAALFHPDEGESEETSGYRARRRY